MGDATAIRVALELLHVPSRVRMLRSGPLPADVLTLLRIAAGEAEIMQATALTVERPDDVVRQAAIFYIEQILLAPEADSYRVLGAQPEASAGELRRNMALLLRWLHPDIDSSNSHALFAARVTRAWEDLKTAERRAAYDATRQVLRPVVLRPVASRPARRGSPAQLAPVGAGGVPAVMVGALPLRPASPVAPDAPAGPARRGMLRRALGFLLGGGRR